MAERLADIVTQIQNIRQLEAVVTAMRGIAASRAQKGRSLLAGIEAYTEVISHAIGRALRLLATDEIMTSWPASAGCGLILFCAEQGFAGAFSERVLDAGTQDLGRTTNMVIGTRGLTVASERGIKIAWTAAMPAHVDAIPGFANRLADVLYDYVADGAIATVDIVFSRSTPSGSINIDRHSLLPIDFARFTRPIETQAPLATLEPELLLERLAAEYVYAQLCQAAMHAFEAENEARMIAMASAKTNIQTKLKALRQRERRLRQDEITTEITELAAGAEASQTR